jgi:hypothetical protein
MKNLIFLLILVSGFSAQAQLSNLPDLAGSISVGRITLYPSPQPITWFQPTAFSSEMTCAGNVSQYRTCTVRIFNRLNPNEKAQIDQLIKTEKLGIVPFSDLDDRVVSEIKENFEDMPEGLNPQILSTASLRMMENNAYASFMFREKKDKAEEILQNYQNGGIGHFKVSFTVHAQRTETYLALENGKCLRQNLETVGGLGLSKKEVNSALNKAIATCNLKYLNYENDEAIIYMRTHLRDTFFDYGYWSGYELMSDKVDQIQDRYVLNSRVHEPITLNCESDLSLNANAIPQTKCLTSTGEVP